MISQWISIPLVFVGSGIFIFYISNIPKYEDREPCWPPRSNSDVEAKINELIKLTNDVIQVTKDMIKVIDTLDKDYDSLEVKYESLKNNQIKRKKKNVD